MKILSKLLFVVLALILSVTAVSSKADAEEGGSQINYSIEPVLPNNQDKDILSYISVSTDEASLKQTFKYRIQNTVDEKQIISVNLLNAYTSANGVIEYKTEDNSINKLTDDNYSFRDYATASKNMTLEPNESKDFNLTVDASNLDGTLLGAVSFSSSNSSEGSKTTNSSVELDSQISTVYGIAINFPTKDIVPEFDLGKPYVDKMPSYYIIRLPVSLETPNLVRDAKIDYKVLESGKELFNGTLPINFAPVSTTDVALPYDSEDFKEDGDYTLEGTLTFKDNNGKEHVETIQTDVKIKNESVVSNLVSKVFPQPTDDGGLGIWAIALIVLIILSLVVLIFFFIRKKKKNKKGSDEDKTSSEKAS